MSLFFTETGATARRTKSSKPKAKSRTIIPLAEQKLLNCSHCPFDKAQLHHPKMPPTGSAKPILYFLGEANGKNEDLEGVQFIGASGSLLRDRIPAKWEKKIRWNNVLRCRPPDNRTPEPLEIACCRRLQIADIEQTKPKVVVGFGNVPLEWMLGPDRQISNWRGRRTPVKIGTHTCWFYAITHPAALLRIMHDKKKGNAHLRAFERDLERLFKDVDNGLPDPFVEPEKDYRHGIFCLNEYGNSGIKKIELALSGFTNDEHAIDIETDRLRPYHPESRILSIAVGDYSEVFAFP
ncbi:MAG: uracil-DNA glycosylase, partial [bacterium]|nr:uracil-DNA glycosylase [bacterium]